MKTSTFAIILASFIASLSIGCATFSDPQSRTILAVKIAAKDGTIIALSKNPEWRPQFVTARDQLKTLLDEGHLSGAQLRSILNELPIKELKSTTAQILISDAELLFDDYVKGLTTLEQVAAIPVVGNAILEGLNYALK